VTARAFRVVGPGRAGGAIALALREAGWRLDRSYGRHDDLTNAAAGVEAVIIATPDRAIGDVARAIRPVHTTVVVHLSGAAGVSVLEPHLRRAAVHPLMTLPDAATGAARLRGGWFAIAGDPFAREIVDSLHGHSFAVADEQRALYHAAASVASNHLVVLLAQVERLAAAAGVPFAAFLPLVRASVDNVEAMGARRALTGPAARGDHDTIARHLEAIVGSERPLYRALSDAARTLASASASVDDDRPPEPIVPESKGEQ
jgi:predicted short-subunit dehydrogenase-like oxidoreductase (DUF2520 family)